MPFSVSIFHLGIKPPFLFATLSSFHANHFILHMAITTHVVLTRHSLQINFINC